ncbi:hypothetical protein O0L34_g8903 [Tuta absoluta]|nr:hypothetical protein O0L34_g8903 [Tuta absoluta]
MKCIVYMLIVLVFSLIEGRSLEKHDYCDRLLPNELIEEIAGYQDIVNDIKKFVTAGEFKGRTYDELAKFVDKFGGRPSGSEVLEQSIDYMIQRTIEEHVNDISTEAVTVPHWERGEERITMLEPRKKNIALFGLGNSVSTPPEGITAEVVVISNFHILMKKPNEEIEGKIVLFDPKFTTYSETNVYRREGATEASKKGAAACLIRSVTPFSIYSPHAGVQSYGKNVTQIPVAAITLEDADLIRRISDRGVKVVLNVEMFSSFDIKTSRNTLIDLKGSEIPEKLVIVSGHIDSWDVGEGAMDDGDGMIVSWAVPIVLNRLNLQPKRTIRCILWTAEEMELIGAYAYEEKHRHEIDNINFIMESDEGTGVPLGLYVSGTEEARCIIAEVLKLFASMNSSTLIEQNPTGTDVSVIIEKGIPGASLYNNWEKYYWFHHTAGDAMNIEDPDTLDLITAFWTAVAYVIADISANIPR